VVEFGSYSDGQAETQTLSCPTGQSGSIRNTHTCTASGQWGAISTINSCAATLLPPRNVNAISSPGLIDVTWTASVGASSYNIWREISPSQPVLYSTASLAAFRDSNLSVGNQYCYYISAVRNIAGGGTETGHPFFSCVVAR
jgi:hypothetical protein